LNSSVESKACYKSVTILLYGNNGEYLVVFLQLILGQENEVAIVSRMIITLHTTVIAWLF